MTGRARQGAAQRPPKAAMLVAQRIVQDAIRGWLKPGNLLEPERTMLEKYQTGRGTLREALRLLEFQGVIALKPGPRGGPVLQDPDASPPRQHPRAAHAAEGGAVPQRRRGPHRAGADDQPAGRRRGWPTSRSTTCGGTVDAMRDKLDDQYSFLDANKRFHDIIAWSSGNVLFGYIVESLLGIMDGTQIGVDYPASDGPRSSRRTRRSTRRCAARDPEASEARMREHIEAYVRYAERKYPRADGADHPLGPAHLG